jgi:ribose-phosphate pyrophosphokinase
VSTTSGNTNLKLNTIPDGKLGIIAIDGIDELAKSIDKYIVQWRRERSAELSSLAALDDFFVKDSYIVNASNPRFGSGEAKGTVASTVRGDDIYILVDICNYSKTYKINGYENCKSPDDYFQDLKRIIAAVRGSCRRVNVVMPYLYEGRQMKRNGRESLDCASSLQELESLGVSSIITFDAHDIRVQNAIPLISFETFQASYQFLKNVLRDAPDMKVDKENLMIISPDESGMNRAIYLANVIGVDMGTFYRRRDYSQHAKDGSSPIVELEFLGADVKGKDMIVLDDMISSGKTITEIATTLKRRGANRIYICATFGMFTWGFDWIDKAYADGLFTKIITTNLIYQPKELLEKEWYISCDMSKYLAMIIDTLNHDASIANLLNPSDRIKKVLKKHENHEEI